MHTVKQVLTVIDGALDVEDGKAWLNQLNLEEYSRGATNRLLNSAPIGALLWVRLDNPMNTLPMQVEATYQKASKDQWALALVEELV